MTNPESVEYFEAGEASLQVYHYNNPIHNSYKIRVGVGVVPLTEVDIKNLTQLLVEYSGQYYTKEQITPWWKRRPRD